MILTKANGKYVLILSETELEAVQQGMTEACQSMIRESKSGSGFSGVWESLSKVYGLVAQYIKEHK